jgi:3-phenylpropionate/trans-cinnamate dioxygenase ferredoxin reductase component
MSEQRFVIVGGSLAGVKAAEALREGGFGGSIVMLEAGHDLPYDRPPLSKGALKGEETYESATLHPQSWYADNDIDLRLGNEVWRIDRSAHEVHMHVQDRLRYDKLLLATGSRVRTINVPGADAGGIFYLRTRDDSQRLQKRFEDRPDVVVVGAGWIGMEAAAAARGYGCAVTIVEPQATPLHSVLGPEVGQVYADLHTGNGVDLRVGEGVSEFVTKDGQVTGVRISGGDVVSADMVVVGVGVLPNTGLAEEAGLEVDNGVLCDQALRTSDPDVYAAGDIAHWFNPLLGQRVRVEHWANAHDGGLIAGRSMLGQDVVYDVVPFFFSDQYDTGMEYAGYVPRGFDATVVTRGDVAGHEFMAFWLDGERVLAGMHMNVWDTIETVQDHIRNARRVDLVRLADADVPLTEVVVT